MKTKILALILCLALALSMLVGCGASKPSSTSEASASSSEGAAVSSSDPADASGAEASMAESSVGLEPDASASSSEATANGMELETTTTDFEVIGTSATGENGSSASLDVTTDFGVDEYTLDLGDQVELADALYHYQSRLRLRATYDSNFKLISYSVLIPETNEDLGQLTPEEIKKAFDWESNYEVIDLPLENGSVILSKMEEGKAYRITGKSEDQSIYIQNDTGKHIMTYGVDSLDNQLLDQFCPSHIIGEPEFCGMDVLGDSLLLRMIVLENEEVENVLGESGVFRLSSVALGEITDIGCAKVIYNDTDSDLKVYDFMEHEYLIPAGDMVGCNWMDLDVFHAEKP